MIGLLDCNNFYCSCERVFRPDLERKPVAVLSNNDGCIISRSEEVKALGIPMAAPLFQYKPLIDKAGVTLFSANFALYGDLSERVMDTLKQFAPAVEVYSIDEAFFDLSPLKPAELIPFCAELKKTIRQWTGIPVSIGIGPSKTLAKLANRIAKKNADSDGVHALTDPARYREELSRCAAYEVWGVGGGLTERLQRNRIKTAWDLAQCDTQWARKEAGVILERTVRELRGTNCLPLDLTNPYRQRILVSRSFGRAVNSLEDLRAAVVTYTVRAAEKLRRQHCQTQMLTVFAGIQPHNDHKAREYDDKSIKLSQPTNDTRKLIEAATQGIAMLFERNRGCRYKKAGVMLDDIQPDDLVQPSLFAPPAAQSAISKTLDAINTRMGAGTVRFAAMDIGSNWRMNQHYRSGRYSTKWNELLVID